jgi:aminopeptidase N
MVELEKASGRDLDEWGRQWLETAGVNTLKPELAGGRRRQASRPSP